MALKAIFRLVVEQLRKHAEDARVSARQGDARIFDGVASAIEQVLNESEKLS